MRALIAALGASAPVEAVDTIFLGGDILTMEDAPSRVEALAVSAGRIVALGPAEEVRTLAGPATEIFDLAGRTLMPGLIEPHCHPIATSAMGLALDVSGFTHGSRASVVDALREAAAEKSPGDWLLAYGWDPVMLEDLDNPTLEELDAIAPDVPMLILTQMMHHAYVNSAGLRAAGISKDTPDPPGGGAFVKDERGELTGVIYEVSALQRVMQALPRPPPGTAALLLNLQYGDYARAGFTTIGVLGPVETGGYPLDFMAELSARPDVPVRVSVYALPAQLERSGWAQRHGDDRFRLQGVKLYMDGSPYTGGAAFAEPYLNTPLTLERMGLERDHRGEVNYTPAALRDAIERYHRAGRQVAIHAQGEVAIDLVLDAFATVLARHPRDDTRHRLEHVALITGPQLSRARSLGLTTSFFIDHVYFYGKGLGQIVGPARAARFMPIGSAFRAGHTPTIHTDNPATPIGPFRAIRTAVTRSVRDGGGTLGPDERIGIADALKTLTIHAAWQIHEERERGSLAEGKLADLVLLSDNPLEIDPARLPEIEVHGTWLAGRPVDPSPWSWTNATLGARVVWGAAKAKLTSWFATEAR